jgi:hypothetical protein
MPIGMPSIAESGLTFRQRSVERSAAVLAASRLSVTKAPIFLLPGIELNDTALEKLARRVFSTSKVGGRRKKWPHQRRGHVRRVHYQSPASWEK